MAPLNREILLEFDEEIDSYYAIWQPMKAVGLGHTRIEALEDLRAAAHFGIETKVNLTLETINGASDS